MLSEFWYNPKQGWRLIKIIMGTLIMYFLGCIYWGCAECGKKVIDKIKTKGYSHKNG